MYNTYKLVSSTIKNAQYQDQNVKKQAKKCKFILYELDIHLYIERLLKSYVRHAILKVYTESPQNISSAFLNKATSK